MLAHFIYYGSSCSIHIKQRQVGTAHVNVQVMLTVDFIVNLDLNRYLTYVYLRLIRSIQ